MGCQGPCGVAKWDTPVTRFLLAPIVLLAIMTPVAAIDSNDVRAAKRFNLGYMLATAEGIPIYARVPLDTVMGNLYAKGVGVPQTTLKHPSDFASPLTVAMPARNITSA